MNAASRGHRDRKSPKAPQRSSPFGDAAPSSRLGRLARPLVAPNRSISMGSGTIVEFCSEAASPLLVDRSGPNPTAPRPHRGRRRAIRCSKRRTGPRPATHSTRTASRLRSSAPQGPSLPVAVRGLPQRTHCRSRFRSLLRCGRMFEPTRPHQKHCRPSCRKAAFNARAERPSLPGMLEGELFRMPFE
jgi:hypothetical protein